MAKDLSQSKAKSHRSERTPVTLTLSPEEARVLAMFVSYAGANLGDLEELHEESPLVDLTNGDANVAFPTEGEAEDLLDQIRSAYGYQA